MVSVTCKDLEVVILYFKVISSHSLGVTEGNHKKNLSQDSLYHSQDSNRQPRDYKSEQLPLEQTCFA